MRTCTCFHLHTCKRAISVELPVAKTQVVPHKAVAQVSRIGHYRRGELLRCMGGGANSWMDQKMVRSFVFDMVAMVAVVTSPTNAGCSVAKMSL